MSIIWFSDVTREDVPLIGQKAANLVELYNNNFPVPPGFIVTSKAFDRFLEENKIEADINSILESIDINNTFSLQKASKSIKEIILSQRFPDNLRDEIFEAYENLNIDKELFKNAPQALHIIKAGRDFPFVVVRASAITERIVSKVFGNQTYLNVKGTGNITRAVQNCWASFFNVDSLIRAKENISGIKLAVIVQKQIQSQKSGIVSSSDLLSNNKDEMLIEAVYGLAEPLINNQVNSDKYIIDKDNLKISNREINEQDFEYLLDPNIKQTIRRSLTKDKREKQVLTDYEILKLAELAKKLENFYSMPLDIEFAVEGTSIHVLQTKPINTLKKHVAGTGENLEKEARQEEAKPDATELKKEESLNLQYKDMRVTLPKNNDNIDIIVKFLQSLKD